MIIMIIIINSNNIINNMFNCVHMDIYIYTYIYIYIYTPNISK